MKIYTENIKKYEKLLSQVYVKGDKFTESLYLNFEDKHIYFKNFNYSGRIKFDFDFDSTVPNFFVNIPLFLALVNQYDYLEIDKDFKFIIGKEEFKISTFQAKIELLDFNYEDENWTQNNLSVNAIKDIEKAIGYSGSDDVKDDYNGVLLNGSYINSTDSSKFFRAKLEEDNFNDIRLSSIILKFIIIGFFHIYLSELDKESKSKITKGENLPTNINLFHKNDIVCITMGDKEFEILCPKVLNLKIPDIGEESFAKKYNHSTHLTFEKQTMLDVLKFFEPFVKTITNERLYFTFLSEKELCIEVKDKIIGNRIINLAECSSEIIGQGVWFARFLLNQALNTIEDDFIKIQFDPNKPASNIIGNVNVKRHVVIVNLFDE